MYPSGATSNWANRIVSAAYDTRRTHFWPQFGIALLGCADAMSQEYTTYADIGIMDARRF